MFCLTPIKLWRNISMIAFGVAMIFTLIGTFTIKGDLVIHWSGEGITNNSAGKWILWTLLLMAFLSIFTHGSLSKKRPGRNTLSIEMAGALSSGLVSMWSIINIILVTYNHYPTTAIPIIALICGAVMRLFGFYYTSVGSIILFFIIATIISYPLNLLASALPKALLALEKINKQSAVIMYLLY